MNLENNNNNNDLFNIGAFGKKALNAISDVNKFTSFIIIYIKILINYFLILKCFTFLCFYIY